MWQQNLQKRLCYKLKSSFIYNLDGSVKIFYRTMKILILTQNPIAVRFALLALFLIFILSPVLIKNMESA